MRNVSTPRFFVFTVLLFALLVSACGQTGGVAPMSSDAAAETSAAPEASAAAPSAAAEASEAASEAAEASVAASAEASEAAEVSEAAEASAAASEAAASTASGEKTLTVAMRELVSSFDYPYDWAIAATWIHSNIGDCLVWRDRATAEFIPWLAESFENVDETTWRFKLREGVSFHNGEPFNAAAVKYTIDRIQGDEKALVYPQWQFIKEVKIVDDYNIEFITGAPEPAFLSKMAGTACQVVPPGYTEEVGSEGFGQSPIGTGPYKFVEWIKDDRVVLEANPDYFRGAPGVDRLIFRAVPEDSSRVAELLTGGIDLMISVPNQDRPRIEENAELAVDEFLTTQVALLALRAGPSKTLTDYTGITENEKVRQAIAYAIDRAAIIELINGMGVPTMTRITPPTLGSSEKLYNKTGTYDPARAQQLLQEAGYNNEPLVFHSTSSIPMQKEVTEAIVAMLQEVGLNVELNFMELTAFREQVYGPRTNRELYMDALGNSFFDPWITVLSEQSDRRERTGWSGPQADEADTLIRAAAVNMDAEARAGQYEQIQDLLLAENGGPYVFLYQMKDTLARATRLTYSPAPDGFLWFGEASIE